MSEEKEITTNKKIVLIVFFIATLVLGYLFGSILEFVYEGVKEDKKQAREEKVIIRDKIDYLSRKLYQLDFRLYQVEGRVTD